MSQEYCSSNEENPIIIKCLSKIYDEIVDIKNHLLELNKRSNNDNGKPDKPSRGQAKTEQLSHCSNCNKISSKPAQPHQTAHLSNKGSNHVHSESKPGPSTVPGSSSNTNSANPDSKNRLKPYPLHRPISQKQTLNSLKDLRSYEVDYRGLFNVMGIVHRLSKSVIQSDNSVKINLWIVDQSMIEVFITINQTKNLRKFSYGQVVMFKNAQMMGKIRRLKANTFQIEPNNEKAAELRKWYNGSAFFVKINTTTINNDDDDDPFNQQQQQ